MKRIDNGESTLEKVRPLSADESLRRHLVLAMKHTELDVTRFESFYPAESRPLARFEPAFEAMEVLGIIERDATRIRYTPEHADLSDRYVRLFYSADVNDLLRCGPSRPVTTLDIRPRRAHAFEFTV